MPDLMGVSVSVASMYFLTIKPKRLTFLLIGFFLLTSQFKPLSLEYFMIDKKYQNKGIHPDKLAYLMEYFVFNYFTVLGLGGNTFFQIMHDYCGKFNINIEKDHSNSKFMKTCNLFKE